MKYYSIVLVLFAGIIISISSCKKDIETTVESVMKIDSIVYPDTVQYDSELRIDFYGVLGDGCNYFSRFESQVLTETDLPNTIRVKVYKNTEQGVSCSEEIKYLHESATVPEKLKGNFYIKVIQPDESILQGVIYVE